MDWARAGKAIASLLLLIFGLYGAYLAGEARSAKQFEEAARAGLPQDPPNIKAIKAHHGLTWGGRFGTTCNVCAVQFAQLIVLPERYNRKFIRIDGFLQRSGLDLMLYPTEDGHRAGLRGYIRIYDDRPTDAPVKLVPPDIESRLKNGVWVHLTGEFSADNDEYTLGELRKVQDIQEIETHSDDKPSAPKVTLRKVLPPNAEVPTIEIAPDTH